MHKKKFEFFDCIKAFLLALPMLFVVVTSLYVIFNQNAKDSYSDYTSANTYAVQRGTNLVTGRSYVVSYTGAPYSNLASNEFYILDGDTNLVELYFPNESWVAARFNLIYENNYTRLLVYDTNSISHNRFSFESISNSFYFVAGTTTATYNTYVSYFNLSISDYVVGSLDNVFEYSLSKFNNLGFNKINFLEWFTSLFIQIGYESNVYVLFLNSYINYFLFTELSLFIPSVFHWIIHFFSDLGKDMTHSHRKEN